MGRARPFARSDVARVFESYPAPMRRRLLRLRGLIFDTAARLGVGRLEETLRWGEPAYVTTTGSGSTIRIDRRRQNPRQYAMYFHCRTSLVDTFRTAFPGTFTFEGNRALVFDEGERVPARELAVCIETALTYHRKGARRRARRQTA
jgi:Domain of unknown function (DU1801)